jgi:hypothetical protein
MRASLAMILYAFLLGGCASQPDQNVVAEVNEKTGDSFTRMREPLELNTRRPALSRVGKDYLLIAPVALAGSPKAGQYLWFAIGTTLDRSLMNAPEPGFDSIVLVVDGMPMTFDLDRWSDMSRTEPYKVGIASAASFASRVTANQLERIARAETLTAYVTNPEHRSPEYVLVRGMPREWADF